MIPRSFSEALALKIDIHEKCGSNDIGKWINEMISSQKGENGLDVGCGTGKQIIPMSQAVGELGYVAGIDINQDSLDAIAKNNISVC